MEKTTPKDFISKAKFHFRFLDEYGFSIVSENIFDDACEVLWASPSVYVSVALTPPQFEARLSLGRIGIDDQPNAFSFEPGDLIQLETCRDWVWQRGSSVDTYLSEFARLLRTCGRSCLEGDQSVFIRMKAARQRLISEWVSSEKADEIRAQAARAWTSHDYGEVVRLYGLLDPVDDVEKKRVAIAKRHLQSRSA
jgi:hypothetical protein